MNFSLPRRNIRQTSSSESSPLVTNLRSSPSSGSSTIATTAGTSSINTRSSSTTSYSTFEHRHEHVEHNEQKPHPWRDLLSYACTVLTCRSSATSSNSASNRIRTKLWHIFSWKRVLAMSVLVIGLSYCGTTQKDKLLDIFEEQPEWYWDHNMYSPTQGGPSPSETDVSSLNNRMYDLKVVQKPRLSNGELNDTVQTRSTLYHRNLLVVQVASSRSLNDLVGISSRPNRAYARQWGRDYAVFSRKATNAKIAKACFDKTVVLDTILSKQQQQRKEQEEENGLGLAERNIEYSHRRILQYDVIAILPPDAIITDLDYDLLDLFPQDVDRDADLRPLVAIPGWKNTTTLDNIIQSGTDVVFFNLRHPYAIELSRVWFEMTQPSKITCGAGNDLQLLMSAIQMVASENSGTTCLSSLVVGLNETDLGFVGSLAESSHVIKGVAPPDVPTSRAVSMLSKLSESKMALQATSDSVCYRYYPKCEVL